MDIKPIPAFYCCYLLRSTVKRSFNYIGSTPNLLRRIKQHNLGSHHGGARRTDRKTLKPWEVTCIVHGFPSKIAALQFEWAWQHTHKSRHAKDDGLLVAPLNFRVSPKSGKVRKRKPSTQARSLTDRIVNLHILLRARSFERWPLSLRFFAKDVYRVFLAVDGKMESRLGKGVKVVVDKNAVEHYDGSGTGKESGDPDNVLALNGVENLDFGYTALKDRIEQSRVVLARSNNKCSVCRSIISKDEDLLLVCEHDKCHAISHLACLSRHFINSSTEPGNRILLPKHGPCPSCKRSSDWSSLVKELSLRTRGDKELAKLTKKPRGKKTTTKAQTMQSNPEDDDDIDKTLEEIEEDEEGSFQDLEEFEERVMNEASPSKRQAGNGFMSINDLGLQDQDKDFQSLEDFGSEHSEQPPEASHKFIVPPSFQSQKSVG